MAGLSCFRVCWAIGCRLRLCACALTASWWGVLWWCVPSFMVGRAALVCAAPHGGVWCGVPLLVGRGVAVCGSLLAGASRVGVWPTSWWGGCGGVWPPSWWGVLWWCVSPLALNYVPYTRCINRLGWFRTRRSVY